MINDENKRSHNFCQSRTCFDNFENSAFVAPTSHLRISFAIEKSNNVLTFASDITKLMRTTNVLSITPFGYELSKQYGHNSFIFCARTGCFSNRQLLGCPAIIKAYSPIDLRSKCTWLNFESEHTTFGSFSQPNQILRHIVQQRHCKTCFADFNDIFGFPINLTKTFFTQRTSSWIIFVRSMMDSTECWK